MRITIKPRSIVFKWRTCGSSNWMLSREGVTIGKVSRSEIVTGARRRVVWDCTCLLPAPTVEDLMFYTLEEAKESVENRVKRFFELAGLV